MPPERERPHYFALEEVARLARESALEHGEHIPTLIVEGSDQSVIGPLELPGTHEARRDMMYSVGFMLAEDGQLGNLQQVFLICEGWMSIPSKEPKIQMAPSKDPARKEVLLIDCLNVQSHKNSLVVYEMIRDERGELSDLRDFDPPDDRGNLSAQSPLLTAFVEGYKAGSCR